MKGGGGDAPTATGAGAALSDEPRPYMNYTIAPPEHREVRLQFPGSSIHKLTRVPWKKNTALHAVMDSLPSLSIGSLHAPHLPSFPFSFRPFGNNNNGPEVYEDSEEDEDDDDDGSGSTPPPMMTPPMMTPPRPQQPRSAPSSRRPSASNPSLSPPLSAPRFSRRSSDPKSQPPLPIRSSACTATSSCSEGTADPSSATQRRINGCGSRSRSGLGSGRRISGWGWNRRTN